jgi:Tol biopolymer transport system component
MVFSVTAPATRGDLWLQEATGEQRVLLQTDFNEGQPALSPDGSLLAYVLDVSGIDEVYLLPASGKGTPTQISSEGGIFPKWSKDGRTLLYREGRTIQAMTIDQGRPTGAPFQRFSAKNLASDGSYALAPDGDSLLAVQLGEGAIPREIRVITDFFGEIERASKAGD